MVKAAQKGYKCMRRGELLNTVWKDIDFRDGKINISPKLDTESTWTWHLKDTDRRNVPLTAEVMRLLVKLEQSLSNQNPYVFVPSYRYKHIQQLQKQGKWTERKGLCPVGNFRYQFRAIMTKAGIEKGEFHDLRRTCLTNWLANGLNEHDVMTMAGHASFEYTRRFYLAIRKDLLDRARKASSAALKFISVAKLLQSRNENGTNKS